MDRMQLPNPVHDKNIVDCITDRPEYLKSTEPYNSALDFALCASVKSARVMESVEKTLHRLCSFGIDDVVLERQVIGNTPS